MSKRHITVAAHAVASNNDPEQTRDVIRNLRAIAASNLHAVLIAARHAERTAVAHREQLEALAVSLTGFDDLLTQVAGPSVLND